MEIRKNGNLEKSRFEKMKIVNTLGLLVVLIHPKFDGYSERWYLSQGVVVDFPGV